MADAFDPTAFIYEGIWTDWTKGRIQGLTWTLCPTKATLLTNSLALFVTLAGGQLWTIIRFTLHQLRAFRRPGEGNSSYTEQQIILRNTATDLHTMRLMTQLAWSSRQKRFDLLKYPIAIAILATLHYTLFVVAGTFSNNLINSGSGGTFSNNLQASSSPVITRSQFCGTWNQTYHEIATQLSGESLDDISLAIEYLAKTNQNVQLSLQYAQECSEVLHNSSMSSACNTLQVPRLDFQTNITQDCPFEPQFCHEKADTVVFDTGVIDSHEHLGINARHSDRLTYRRLTTCSVLNDTGRVIETSQGTPLATTAAYYGESVSQSTNWTYSYSNFSSLYTEFTPQSNIPYQVNTQLSYGVSPTSEEPDMFIPLPDLVPQSADLILFFLSFTGRYFNQIDDPWFAAHQLHEVDTQNPLARMQYARDSPISTLGCVEQHKFCNSNGSCTPFLGWMQARDVGPFNATLTPNQKVTFERMLRAAVASSIAQITLSLGKTSTPLLAMKNEASQSHSMSLWLPDDQWQRELKNWHTVAMAQLQRTMVQWATGQVAPRTEGQLLRPNTAPDMWFCNSLMIRSTVYQSFNVLTLALTVALGACVIILSWTIEDMTAWFQLRSNKGPTLRGLWDNDHILRLRNYTARSSWKPRPPPKDHLSVARQLGVSGDVKMAFPGPRLAFESYGCLNGTIGQPRFPRFHLPRTNAGSPEIRFDQGFPTGMTDRIWSPLPREPSRDSWLEQNHNNNDFAETEMREYLPEFRKPKMPESLVTRSNTGRTLELSDLRAHALARTRDHRR